jgi:hypothetical protein
VRSLIVVAALAATAHADSLTVVDVGATGGMRTHAESFDAIGHGRAHPAAGLRLTLSFERPPLQYIDHPVHEARFVPELFVGALGDDRLGEGYVGAGLRLEEAVAAQPERMNGGMYAAGRGLVIGKHQDSAVELALGSYLRTRSGSRIGWEVGVMARPRDRERRHELDALVTLYIGL